MKKFIFKTMCFTLPILVAAITMEILLRQIPNDYKLKKNFWDENAEEIETLILGSSHSYYGLNPEFFSEGTFNASHISQPLYYDFEILKKHQSQLENIKTIVLPISYFTFYYQIHGSHEGWRVKNYVIYYRINTSESITSYSCANCSGNICSSASPRRNANDESNLHHVYRSA